jgi:hypothetical protein
MILLLSLGVFGVYVLIIAVVCVAAVGASVLTGGLAQGYRRLRGGRNCDSGVPCLRCRRTAFPVEGTLTRYRCWNCGSRFDGAEHC